MIVYVGAEHDFIDPGTFNKRGDALRYLPGITDDRFPECVFSGAQLGIAGNAVNIFNGWF